MKKIILKIGLRLALICGPGVLWASPDLFNNYTHYLSYEKDTFTTGLKTELSFAEGRFGINSKCNYNFGLSVFSDNYLKNFPMEVQAGNLSVGGIISKLNSPLADTSVSGFSSVYSEPSIITSSLPSYNSFSKDFSTFVQGGWKNENFILREAIANGTYTPSTKDLSFSGKISLAFTDNFAITNTVGFSFFTLKENNSSYWYLTVPYYKESGSFCFGEEIAVRLFNFSANFSLFGYKSPFSQKNSWKIIENIYKTQCKFETNHFKIGISGIFNNNKNIISRDNKVLAPCTQLKTNIQCNFDFGQNNDYSIRAGVTAYGNISGLQNDEDDFKIGFATAGNFPLSSLLLAGSFSYKIFENSGKTVLKFISGNIENVWKIGFFSPEIGISSQYYIPENYTISKNIAKNYSINIDFSFFGDKIINNNSFSFSAKDNKICNQKLKTGINITFIYKKIMICGKIAGEFCLY